MLQGYIQRSETLELLPISSPIFFISSKLKEQEKTIEKKLAIIQHHQNERYYTIMNLESQNEILLNNRQIDPTSSIKLNHKDEIKINNPQTGDACCLQFFLFPIDNEKTDQLSQRPASSSQCFRASWKIAPKVLATGGHSHQSAQITPSQFHLYSDNQTLPLIPRQQILAAQRSISAAQNPPDFSGTSASGRLAVDLASTATKLSSFDQLKLTKQSSINQLYIDDMFFNRKSEFGNETFRMEPTAPPEESVKSGASIDQNPVVLCREDDHLYHKTNSLKSASLKSMESDRSIRQEMQRLNKSPSITPKNIPKKKPSHTSHVTVDDLLGMSDSNSAGNELFDPPLPNQSEVNLQMQMDEKLKEIATLTGLVASFQRDLTSKDEELGQLRSEKCNMKIELDKKTKLLDEIESKSAQNDNKDHSESYLEKLVAQLQKEKQIDHFKISELEQELSSNKQIYEATSKTELKLQDELRQLQASHLAVNQKLEDFQRTECLVRVDAQNNEKKYDKLRSNLMQIVFSIPKKQRNKLIAEENIGSPTTSPTETSNEESIITDETLTNVIKVMSRYYLNHDLIVEGLEQELNKTKEDVRNYILSLENYAELLNNELTTSLKEPFEDITSEKISLLKNRFNHSINSVISTTSIWKKLCDNIQNGIIQIFENYQATLHQIESSTLRQNKKDEEKMFSSGIIKEIDTLHSKIEELIKEKEDLITKISETDRNYLNEIESLKASMATIEENKQNEINIAVDSQICKDAEKLNENKKALKTKYKEKFEKFQAANLEQLAMASKSSEDLQKNIDEKADAIKHLQEKLNCLAESLNEKEKTERSLKAAIEQLETTCENQREKFDADLKFNKSNQMSELNEYREQIRQHGRTICALEERLNAQTRTNERLNVKIKEHQNQIEQLNSSLEEKVEQLAKSTTMSLPPPQPIITEQHPKENTDNYVPVLDLSQITNMERIIEGLRIEIVNLKEQLAQEKQCSDSLRKDFNGAAAKLSDVQGEMTEKQKAEFSEMKIQLEKSETKIKLSQTQLSDLSELADNLKFQLENSNQIISRQNGEAKDARKKLQDLTSELEQVRGGLANEQERALALVAKSREEVRVCTDLASVGQQCRGDRHDLIIDRQKKAMSELRERIRHLEETRMATPEAEMAVKQLILLKKELAEMRAQQALKDSTNSVQMSTMLNVYGGVNRLTGSAAKQNQEDKAGFGNITDEESLLNHPLVLDKIADAESRGERRFKAEQDRVISQLNEINRALEISETSYMESVQALKEALEITDSKQIASLLAADNNELMINEKLLQKIRKERHETAAGLAQRCATLLERLSRKDKLLQGYEVDLVKLRQAEELASRRNSQLESTTKEIRSKAEEVDLLRETLNRTRELLNQEKRVNTAIKQKKLYVPERDLDSQTPEKPKYHCPPANINEKEQQKSKNKEEKIKRKNYEIQALKCELVTRDKELNKAKSKINTLETAIDDGMEKCELPVEPNSSTTFAEPLTG